MDISMDIGIDSLYKYIDLQEDDVVLYLGGRIDDDNLYPKEYRKYLNSKIKELNPSKIICHTHWYAKKYYDGGVLDESTKIDMILVQYHDFKDGTLQTIDPVDYNGDHRSYIKAWVDKNPDMIYAMYLCGNNLVESPKTVEVDDSWFNEDYDSTNIKCFYFLRGYFPDDLMQEAKKETINATDGFAVITHLVEAGCKNLNIVGFTAFGSGEDQSYFTAYGLSDSRFAGKKYFDIKTSECQRVEADILKNYVEQKKINNLEDYDELKRHLKKG